MAKKVQKLYETLLELAKIATIQPDATFTAFGHGYVHNPSKNLGKILAPILATCHDIMVLPVSE